MKRPHASVAPSVIKGLITINGAVDLVKIPNDKSQMTNKFQ
jgi:hypothetical protein